MEPRTKRVGQKRLWTVLQKGARMDLQKEPLTGYELGQRTSRACLIYTSDAADEEARVDLRRERREGNKVEQRIRMETQKREYAAIEE